MLSVLSIQQRALRWAGITPASPSSSSLCSRVFLRRRWVVWNGPCRRVGVIPVRAVGVMPRGGLLREQCFPGSPEPVSVQEPVGSSEPAQRRTEVTSSDFQRLFPLPGKARAASLRLSHAASLAGGSRRVTGNFKTQLQMTVSLLQSTFMHRGHCCLSAIML